MSRHDSRPALRRPSSEITVIGPTEYPVQLRQLPQSPEKLWMRGRWPVEGTKYLAVVGSRALSAYGREACEMLISGLRGYPISVVSGLALGADACAHRAALDAGLHTVAIPGSGLDGRTIYPRIHAALAREILEAGGTLLSEHEPHYKAHPYDFPSRNRLMVGLADAVLVVEAGRKSGTLITARLAGEYSRDLLCIPHRIGDPHAFAAHLFLRLGAAHVTEPMHILEALGISPREDGAHSTREEHKNLAKLASLSTSEQALYAALSTPLARDELIRASTLATGDALGALASLEIGGLIVQQFGLWRRQ